MLEQAAQFLIPLLGTEEKARPFGIDMSIESMSSQQFSVGIFYFLIVAILVFVGITLMFMFKDNGKKEGGAKLKTGEKWMFAWIMFGVLVAIVFGAAQMMHGFLF
ncbi:MAG: hypothetical protein OEZ68_16745 [Gammaproteobacteria bacterium]|nr:hypothetical protein [Gammaproteobacteria bacterium]MDH5802452.1 hypothetical protein [Gammaproteobacteria bacterium]